MGNWKIENSRHVVFCSSIYCWLKPNFQARVARSMVSARLRAVPLRSVTSKFGRTGESELTERGTGERREEEGLPSLLNQTCSGNSAHPKATTG